jgi:antirestriction protein
MLAASVEPGAEEWAIHDYEGFGPVHLGEWENLERVSRLARGIRDHGPAYALWTTLSGEQDLERFEEAYLGHWDSVTAYAEELLSDLGLVQDIERVVPEGLRPYVTIDAEGFGRDLERGGDIFTAPADVGVYVFWGRW